MIGYYNKSVIVTYFALVMSVCAMAAAMNGSIRLAMIILMICGMCDMIDGPIARRCKRNDDEKSFGIQIDSLCDLVCFGACPASICMSIAGINAFTVIAAAFYTLAGVIRLGYFNVQEIKRVQVETGRRKYYDGLPITSGALILPLVAVIDIFLNGFNAFIYPAALLAIGIMFIAPVHIPKLRLGGMICCAMIGIVVLIIMIAQGYVLDI